MERQPGPRAAAAGAAHSPGGAGSCGVEHPSGGQAARRRSLHCGRCKPHCPHGVVPHHAGVLDRQLHPAGSGGAHRGWLVGSGAQEAGVQPPCVSLASTLPPAPQVTAGMRWPQCSVSSIATDPDRQPPNWPPPLRPHLRAEAVQPAQPLPIPQGACGTSLHTHTCAQTGATARRHGAARRRRQGARRRRRAVRGSVWRGHGGPGQGGALWFRRAWRRRRHQGRRCR